MQNLCFIFHIQFLYFIFYNHVVLYVFLYFILILYLHIKYSHLVCLKMTAMTQFHD